MVEVALLSLLTLRRPTPQPPPKYIQPGRQVSVRVREVDAAPRCACRPRTAGSAFERLGLERARSRKARRPHRAVRVNVHHPATALQGAGQLDAQPVPRASDMIDSSTPVWRPGTRDAASATGLSWPRIARKVALAQERLQRRRPRVFGSVSEQVAIKHRREAFPAVLRPPIASRASFWNPVPHLVSDASS
jgi:hypothetical protein